MYPVDIHEDDEHIYVDAEMPGFRKDQIEVTLDAVSADEARQAVTEMCDRLLANPVIEDFSFEISEATATRG